MRDQRPTLLAMLGGRDAGARVAEAHSAMVREDELLAPVFHGTDATALRTAMSQFLAMVLGGSSETADPLLRASMVRLRSRGFTDAHLERWVDLLLRAAREQGADDDATDQLAMNAACARERLFRP